MYQKIQEAKELLTQAFQNHKNIAVSCSFGKDSTVSVHLARDINPAVPIFSIMTHFKPKATFEYLVKINKLLNLDVTVYMVADKTPSLLVDNKIKTILLPLDEYKSTQNLHDDFLYNIDPDECCRLLKVIPIKVALKKYDAVIAGLRRSEGESRKNLQPIEHSATLTKYHPIYDFSEAEIFNYLKLHNIPIHPWYSKVFEDGRKYRSLGCEPCTCAILPHQSERMGRWVQKSSKKGGECGIHTNILKDSFENGSN